MGRAFEAEHEIGFRRRRSIQASYVGVIPGVFYVTNHMAASNAGWCDICRGDAGEGGDKLLKCKACHKKYHLECAGMRSWPEAAWTCSGCEGHSRKDTDLKRRIRAVRSVHRELRARAASFYEREREALAPFVSEEALTKLTADAASIPCEPLTIGPKEPYIQASLRDYQVDGVNWILSQYAHGTGGILGDEMGLGKTIQTLSFISALKASGLPGPHLVVTPLAVLQNWANEMKRFTPTLSFVKIHGGVAERDRILSDASVVDGAFDVYLTTYDTLRAEEPFFTDSLLFHTITIDEGHRLKNEASSLCASLARVSVPFRLLLTGTPLQNNM